MYRSIIPIIFGVGLPTVAKESPRPFPVKSAIATDLPCPRPRGGASNLSY